MLGAVRRCQETGSGEMRRFIRIAAFLLIAFAPPAFADHSPVHIVVDLGSGKVIDHSGAGKLWQPASVTKIMTGYVAFKAMKSGKLTPESRVVVTKNALKEPPSKMGYKVGTDMTLDDALKMMIVRSANDIAVAIAETVGGTEAKFIAMMNAEAKRLGMNSTRYTNPNGLPDDRQVTTARDIAVLARAIWLEFPEYRHYFKIPAIRVGRKVLRSHNKLLERFRGANGMKTGFICASGFNMVATATRRGRTVAVVILGANSANERAEIAAKLLRNGFKRKFGTRPALESFRSAKAKGPAPNLRPEICSKKVKKKEHPLLAKGRSALIPRFVLMEPVRVTTGVAKSKRPSASPTVKVPLPPRRPPMPGDKSAASVDLRILLPSREASGEGLPMTQIGPRNHL